MSILDTSDDGFISVIGPGSGQRGDMVTQKFEEYYDSKRKPRKQKKSANEVARELGGVSVPFTLKTTRDSTQHSRNKHKHDPPDYDILHKRSKSALTVRGKASEFLSLLDQFEKKKKMNKFPDGTERFDSETDDDNEDDDRLEFPPPRSISVPPPPETALLFPLLQVSLPRPSSRAVPHVAAMSKFPKVEDDLLMLQQSPTSPKQEPKSALLYANHELSRDEKRNMNRQRALDESLFTLSSLAKARPGEVAWSSSGMQLRRHRQNNLKAISGKCWVSSLVSAAQKKVEDAAAAAAGETPSPQSSLLAPTPLKKLAMQLHEWQQPTSSSPPPQGSNLAGSNMMSPAPMGHHYQTPGNRKQNLHGMVMNTSSPNLLNEQFSYQTPTKQKHVPLQRDKFKANLPELHTDDHRSSPQQHSAALSAIKNKAASDAASLFSPAVPRTGANSNNSNSNPLGNPIWKSNWSSGQFARELLKWEARIHRVAVTSLPSSAYQIISSQSRIQDRLHYFSMLTSLGVGVSVEPKIPLFEGMSQQQLVSDMTEDWPGWHHIRLYVTTVHSSTPVQNAIATRYLNKYVLPSLRVRGMERFLLVEWIDGEDNSIAENVAVTNNQEPRKWKGSDKLARHLEAVGRCTHCDKRMSPVILALVGHDSGAGDDVTSMEERKKAADMGFNISNGMESMNFSEIVLEVAGASTVFCCFPKLAADNDEATHGHRSVPELVERMASQRNRRCIQVSYAPPAQLVSDSDLEMGDPNWMEFGAKIFTTLWSEIRQYSPLSGPHSAYGIYHAKQMYRMQQLASAFIGDSGKLHTYRGHLVEAKVVIVSGARGSGKTVLTGAIASNWTSTAGKNSNDPLIFCSLRSQESMAAAMRYIALRLFALVSQRDEKEIPLSKIFGSCYLASSNSNNNNNNNKLDLQIATAIVEDVFPVAISRIVASLKTKKIAILLDGFPYELATKIIQAMCSPEGQKTAIVLLVTSDVVQGTVLHKTAEEVFSRKKEEIGRKKEPGGFSSEALFADISGATPTAVLLPIATLTTAEKDEIVQSVFYGMGRSRSVTEQHKKMMQWSLITNGLSDLSQLVACSQLLALGAMSSGEVGQLLNMPLDKLLEQKLFKAFELVNGKVGEMALRYLALAGPIGIMSHDLKQLLKSELAQLLSQEPNEDLYHIPDVSLDCMFDRIRHLLQIDSQSDPDGAIVPGRPEIIQALNTRYVLESSVAERQLACESIVSYFSRESDPTGSGVWDMLHPQALKLVPEMLIRAQMLHEHGRVTTTLGYARAMLLNYGLDETIMAFQKACDVHSNTSDVLEQCSSLLSFISENCCVLATDPCAIYSLALKQSRGSGQARWGSALMRAALHTSQDAEMEMKSLSDLVGTFAPYGCADDPSALVDTILSMAAISKAEIWAKTGVTRCFGDRESAEMRRVLGILFEKINCNLSLLDNHLDLLEMIVVPCQEKLGTAIRCIEEEFHDQAAAILEEILAFLPATGFESDVACVQGYMYIVQGCTILSQRKGTMASSESQTESFSSSSSTTTPASATPRQQAPEETPLSPASPGSPTMPTEPEEGKKIGGKKEVNQALSSFALAMETFQHASELVPKPRLADCNTGSQTAESLLNEVKGLKYFNPGSESDHGGVLDAEDLRCALTCFNRAAVLANNLGDKEGAARVQNFAYMVEARVHICDGYEAMRRWEFEPSRKFFQKAAKLFDITGDVVWAVRARANDACAKIENLMRSKQPPINEANDLLTEMLSLVLQEEAMEPCLNEEMVILVKHFEKIAQLRMASGGLLEEACQIYSSVVSHLTALESTRRMHAATGYLEMIRGTMVLRSLDDKFSDEFYDPEEGRAVLDTAIDHFSLAKDEFGTGGDKDGAERAQIELDKSYRIRAQWLTRGAARTPPPTMPLADVRPETLEEVVDLKDQRMAYVQHVFANKISEVMDQELEEFEEEDGFSALMQQGGAHAQVVAQRLEEQTEVVLRLELMMRRAQKMGKKELERKVNKHLKVAKMGLGEIQADSAFLSGRYDDTHQQIDSLLKEALALEAEEEAEEDGADIFDVAFEDLLSPTSSSKDAESLQAKPEKKEEKQGDHVGTDEENGGEDEEDEEEDESESEDADEDDEDGEEEDADESESTPKIKIKLTKSKPKKQKPKKQKQKKQKQPSTTPKSTKSPISALASPSNSHLLVRADSSKSLESPKTSKKTPHQLEREDSRISLNSSRPPSAESQRNGRRGSSMDLLPNDPKERLEQKKALQKTSRHDFIKKLRAKQMHIAAIQKMRVEEIATAHSDFEKAIKMHRESENTDWLVHAKLGEEESRAAVAISKKQFHLALELLASVAKKFQHLQDVTNLERINALQKVATLMSRVDFGLEGAREQCSRGNWLDGVDRYENLLKLLREIVGSKIPFNVIRSQVEQDLGTCLSEYWRAKFALALANENRAAKLLTANNERACKEMLDLAYDQLSRITHQATIEDMKEEIYKYQSHADVAQTLLRLIQVIQKANKTLLEAKKYAEYELFAKVMRQLSDELGTIADVKMYLDSCSTQDEDETAQKNENQDDEEDDGTIVDVDAFERRVIRKFLATMAVTQGNIEQLHQYCELCQQAVESYQSAEKAYDNDLVSDCKQYYERAVQQFLAASSMSVTVGVPSQWKVRANLCKGWATYCIMMRRAHKIREGIVRDISAGDYICAIEGLNDYHSQISIIEEKGNFPVPEEIDSKLKWCRAMREYMIGLAAEKNTNYEDAIPAFGAAVEYLTDAGETRLAEISKGHQEYCNGLNFIKLEQMAVAKRYLGTAAHIFMTLGDKDKCDEVTAILVKKWGSQMADPDMWVTMILIPEGAVL